MNRSTPLNDNFRKILESVDDFTAGYLRLMEDYFFHKIPVSIRESMVKDAIKKGRETAAEIIEEVKTADPWIIARHLGLEVVSVCQENCLGGLLIRSEYIPPKTIRIYKKSIEQLNKAIIKMRIEDFFPVESIANLHLAHEIFHHLENIRVGALSKKHNVYAFRLGPLRFKISIFALSEIAAHAFSKNVTCVNAFPSLLDYIVKDNGINELLTKLSKAKLC